VTDPPETRVTQLLLEASRGDQQAVDELFEKVYAELRGLAKNYWQDERADHTLQATALVHEAYLRLVGTEQIEWQNRAHFFSIAAQVMRHILVDHARRHSSEKRGSGERKLALDEAVSFAEDRDVNLVALDDALKALAELDEQQSRIVELRFFAGLSIKEVAAALDISEIAVSRKWSAAKLWLRKQISTKE
jgi:RNA polymerase sigma-70 factor (ECF subfamily)